MKKLIALLFLSISIPSFAGDEVSTMLVKNSNQYLVYSRDQSQHIFTLKNKLNDQYENEVARIDLNFDGEELKIDTSKDRYNFKIFKSLKNASKKAYNWCWDGDLLNVRPALAVSTIGVVSFFVTGTLFTTPLLPIFAAAAVSGPVLCGAVPGLPFITGIALAPVDAAITTVDRITNKKMVAARKFQKLLKGKTVTVTKKVFETVIKELSKI
jgi:hypothetical protein